MPQKSNLGKLTEEEREAFRKGFRRECGMCGAPVNVGESQDRLIMYDESELAALRQERDALKAKQDEWIAVYDKVINDRCASDEVHCGCVPFLRERVREMTEEKNRWLGKAADLACDYGIDKHKMVDLRERVRELEIRLAERQGTTELNANLIARIDALQSVVDAAVEILHSEDYSIDHAWHCKSTHGKGDPCNCDLYSKEIAFNAALLALSPSGEKE